jgi:hypothetical protein
MADGETLDALNERLRQEALESGEGGSHDQLLGRALRVTLINPATDRSRGTRKLRALAKSSREYSRVRPVLVDARGGSARRRAP